MKHMVDVIATVGPGLKPPKADEIMSKYLSMVKEDLHSYIEGLKKIWSDYLVTIMANGWTNFTRR